MVRRSWCRNLWGSLIVFAGVAVLVTFVLSPAVRAEALTAQDIIDFWRNLYPPVFRTAHPMYTARLLAQASPDECFYGLGDYRNDYLAQSCAAPGQWKTNETVIWGLVKSGSKLWFGTLANSRCTSGGDPIYGAAPFWFPGSMVCEFGESKLSPPFPDPFGDWRPPAIYVYRLETGQLERKALLIPTSFGGGFPLVSGIRGGGVLNGIVFLGGAMGVPKTPTMGVALFAFNSETEEFLGWHELKAPDGSSYLNVRSWLAHKGHLYVGVWQEKGGKILRWLGDAEAIKRGDLSTLWLFEEVGRVSQQPSNMEVYQDRLVVGTWPMDNAKQTVDSYKGGALWLSPPFEDHLTTQDMDRWTRVWSYDQYEPNLTSNLTNGVGAVKEYGGYLWWGMQQPPGRGWLVHKDVYSKIIPGYPDEEQDVVAFYGTWRPTTVFRGRHMGTPEQEVEIVYGFEELPRFVLDQGSPHWELAKNKMNKKPLWGLGGFGNFYLFYTYSMAVHQGRLFIGTNEISLRFAQMDVPFPLAVPSDANLWGVELWRIDEPQSPAVAETLNGFGDYFSNSIKSLISSEEGLFLSMGNPYNLMTSRDDGLPEGGWKLVVLEGSDPVAIPAKAMEVPDEVGVASYSPEKAMNGYTLIGTVGSPTTPPAVLLVDMQGTVVNRWMMTGIPAKMLPGGRVLGRTSLAANEILFVEKDWKQQDVWSLPIYMDHDFEREGNPVGYYAPGLDFVPNGRTLLMTLEEKEVPEISSQPLMDPALYEFNYDGTKTDFSWHGADHFDEYGFDEAAKAAIYERGGDWLHLNTVSLVGPNPWYDQGDERFHPDNIILCSRHANFVAIVDRFTGHVVWRIGPDFSNDRPEHPIGQLLGPHHAHIIPQGLPGAGNMLIFDNGAPSGYGGFSGYPKYPGRRYSRVVEFNPVTYEVVWEYKADKKSETPFKSMAMGAAQRLPNGNTLITFPNQSSTYPEQGRLVEVTPAKEVVWDYWVYWNRVPMTPYRAYRVPPEWLPEGVNPAGYPFWSSLNQSSEEQPHGWTKP